MGRAAGKEGRGLLSLRRASGRGALARPLSAPSLPLAASPRRLPRFGGAMLARRAPRLAADPFTVFPHAVVLRVLASVPVDTLLRCREVSRAWRTTLDEERSLWTRLYLRPERTYLSTPSAWSALLRAALARAGGELVSLDAVGNPWLAVADLMHAAASNASSLRELRVSTAARVEDVDALLRAAPQLQVLEIAASCRDASVAVQLLNNATPLYGPLRLRRLGLNCFLGRNATESEISLLVAGIKTHGSLRKLSLYRIDLSTAFDALVEAALVRRIRSLELVGCNLRPTSAPALARLINGGALEVLNLIDRAQLFFDLPGAQLLGEALQSNTVLTELRLTISDLWRVPGAGTAVLKGLVGHPSLRTLALSNFTSDASSLAAGAALAALLDSNATALENLMVSSTTFGDDGLALMFMALKHNTHLHVLSCGGCGASETFVSDTLLPAIKVNRGLYVLNLTGLDWPCAREAEAFVAANAEERCREHMLSAMSSPASSLS